MNRRKRMNVFLAVILTFGMLIGLVPTTAQAEKPDEQVLTYESQDNQENTENVASQEESIENTQENPLEEDREEGGEKDIPAQLFQSKGEMAVYLNGSNGDDTTNDGLSEGAPVLTFNKAKEIAREQSNDTTPVVIYIMDTVEIEGEINLTGINARVQRHKDFQETWDDTMFSVPEEGKATLKDIEISGDPGDGDPDDEDPVRGAIISVKNATLTIEKGTLLENNHSGAIMASSSTINITGGMIGNNTTSAGGGISADSSTINMTGGIIRNNTATQQGGGISAEWSMINMTGGKIAGNTTEFGGGIYLSSSRLNISGGTISENQAIRGGGVYAWGKEAVTNTQGDEQKIEINFTGGTIESNKAQDSPASDGAGSGGGIFVFEKASLHMSSEALIRNNYAETAGGGIATGHIGGSGLDGRLFMEGGQIEGNQAGVAGGGIYLHSDLGFNGNKDVYSAEITGGSIINNKTTGANPDYGNDWGDLGGVDGGGGIFIYANYYYDPLGLKLSNALISDNHAERNGGGIAIHSNTQTSMNETDGAAIYNNTAKGEAPDDIYTTYDPDKKSDRKFNLAYRMLGGRLYSWEDAEGNSVDVDNLEFNDTELTTYTFKAGNPYKKEEIKGLPKGLYYGKHIGY